MRKATQSVAPPPSRGQPVSLAVYRVRRAAREILAAHDRFREVLDGRTLTVSELSSIALRIEGGIATLAETRPRLRRGSQARKATTALLRALDRWQACAIGSARAVEAASRFGELVAQLAEISERELAIAPKAG
jgi:hypothetical protein